MKNKCAVPNCKSRRSNVKLHQFPKTEIALKWATAINCNKLKNLSHGELCKFFVCHNHFEKRFVTKSLRLRTHAYPSLFANDEIEAGFPLTPCNDDIQGVNEVHKHTQLKKRKHEDHTYSLKEEVQLHPDIQRIKLNRQHDYMQPTKGSHLDDNQPFSPKECIAMDLNLNLLETEPQKQTDKTQSSTMKVDEIQTSTIYYGDVTLENLTYTINYGAETLKNLTSTIDNGDKSLENLASTIDDDETLENLASTIGDDETLENLASTIGDDETLENLASTIGDDETLENLASTIDDGSDETLQPDYLSVFKNFVIRKKHKTPENTNLTPKRQKPKEETVLKKGKKAKKRTRARKVVRFSKKQNFDKMTKKLNPLAKKILWMQVNQSTKRTRGRRFTDEEKIIALEILKQSPTSYKFLSKIFILPSIKTLNKMTSILRVANGIDSQIFSTIQEEMRQMTEVTA